jgi:UDP-N-acetyl-D-mannosaminuronate dehydrogenase
MRSGIGVGGYCLTKDPLFAEAASKQILNKKFNFPISSKAVEVNKKMTFDVMSEVKERFKKKIFGKKVLLLGVSYREDTSDTRYSAAEGVFTFFKKMHCNINFHDPAVHYWEYARDYSIKKNFLNNFDVYVYLVKHKSFKKLKINYKNKSLILDLNHVLERKKKLDILKNKRYESFFIGSKQR